MKVLQAVTVLLATLQNVYASSISKLATGTASGFYAALAPFAAQIAAVGDPEPSTMYWNSGGFAPQYIELEFPCFYTVHNIFLQVGQHEKYDRVHTIHKLYAGSTNQTNLVATVDGNTTNRDWIHKNFSPPLTNIRFLRVATVLSPSWVAWNKILVF